VPAGVAHLLDHLVARAPVGLAILDPDLRFLFVNERVAGASGLSADEHAGRTLEEVYGPDGADARRDIEPVVRTGEPLHNHRVVYADRVFSIDAFPLHDGGELVAVGITAFDVTERDEERGLLDALFERAPIGLGFWDRDLRYRRLNAALAEMNGLPVDAHLGRTVAEVLPGLPADVMDSMRMVVEEGRPLLGTVARGETPAAPGVTRTWRVSYYPVQDRRGEVSGVGIVCEEITEVEALRSELAVERSLLDEVIAKAPIGIVVLWGRELRFQTVNARGLAMLPDPGVEMVGRDLEEVFPELMPLAAETAYPVLDSGEPLVFRDLAAPFTGGERFYDVTYTPIRRGEEVAGVLVTYVETTDQVRERRALQDELAAERRLADTLQRALLPRHLPDVPGLRIAARYRAAGERFDVGGDFYDVFPSRHGTWFAVVGDVCGKGPEAAARTAMARYALRAEATRTTNPERLLLMLNEDLRREDPEGSIFITLACAALTPEAGAVALRLALAGHPRPILLGPDGAAQPVGERATPVGVLEAPRFREFSARMLPGSALAIYTDGLLDAQAPARPLGEEDVADAMAGLRAEGPETLAGGLEALTTTGGAEPRDDCALLVLSVAGGRPRR
jgi:PAS domain S-box-containing protein